MKIAILSILLTLNAYALVLDNEYYPEERQYNQNSPSDKGYTQYGTPSLFGKREFALTYDDGPHLINTPVLLDHLKKYEAKATFFLVMERVGPKSIPLIKRMLDEGHIVGLHSMHHLNSNKMTREQFKADTKESLLKLNNAIKQTGHTLSEIFFRFPFAAYAENKNYHHLNVLRELSYELYQENCIQFVFWDHDTTDWIGEQMSPQEIFSNLKSFNEGGEYITYKTIKGPQGTTFGKVYKNIQSPLQGGTILMHDIHERTVKATELYLEYAKNNGLKILPISESVEYKPNENTKCVLKD
jgi:peptidoglycan/xylan/chitin deacetylase (PgdA/CDA1 family)